MTLSDVVQTYLNCSTVVHTLSVLHLLVNR